MANDDMIDLDALETQMNETNKQIAELKKANIETSKKVFNTAIAKFFQLYPEVAAITWTQYTPYFNDGDACEFSVYEPSFLSAEDLENKSDIELYNYSSWQEPSSYVYEKVANKDNRYGNLQDYIDEIEKYEKLKNELGPRLQEIQLGVKKFESLFKKIDDDTMEALFGDHVEVTATPKGIDVDEYSHD